jgi:sodium/hydrogen exchanger 8
MTFLLPPIIFEAGFNLQVTPFIKNLGPTAFFAFIGTFASTFVVGGMVYVFGQWGLCYPLGPLAALVFGSLISATDPVTVIAVFNKIGVKADLFSMVFGESVLNDAVAIVLSRTLLSFLTKEVNTQSILGACVLFVEIFLGSLLIGLAAGLLSSVVFKLLKLKQGHDHFTMEAALSFVFPWASYFVAEALELSGLVAILTCGMAMATYTRYNFSEKGAILTMRAYKAVAAIAETFVFVYLGMAMVAFPIMDHTVVSLVVLSLLACFVGRLHIPVGSWLANCFRKSDGSTLPPVSGVYQFLMWWSGLRGGVAFALAANSFAHMDFPEVCGGGAELPGCDPSMKDSEAILQTTMLIAVFTIFVFGGSITAIAVKADVMEKADDAHQPKTDGHIIGNQLKDDSEIMSDLDKSGLILKMLTNEASYPQKAADEKALQDKAKEHYYSIPARGAPKPSAPAIPKPRLFSPAKSNPRML